MNNYLYGAAVQGIQSFLFQTNMLREIVGASELVDEVCTRKFLEIAGIDKDHPNIILNAAGNIKFIFEQEEKCRSFVRIFPKEVMEMAPGITISQAVVKYEAGGLNQALQNLEIKLRIQRNLVSIPLETGFMGTERYRRTGGVAFQRSTKDKNVILDEATIKKLVAAKKNSLFEKISNNIEIKNLQVDLLKDIDSLFENESNTWLAIVHADGNGLGAIIQNLNKSLEEKDDMAVKDCFKTFSKALDNSTKAAAQEAFKNVILKAKKENKPYPIRPVILGGDDLTVIIKADLAFDFTTEFLIEFEKQTREHFGFLSSDYNISGFENGITACAGIAYVKKSYPFHYAVDLAEKLCSDAKNFVKSKGEYENRNLQPEQNGLVPKSSLAFFKVQDSFIEDSLNEMKERTLKSENINFAYGPYLIEADDRFANIVELQNKLEVIKTFEDKEGNNGESKGISKLRNWTTEAFKDKTTADFMLERMHTVNADFYDKIKLGDHKKNCKSIIYDVIQLSSFND